MQKCESLLNNVIVCMLMLLKVFSLSVTGVNFWKR